MSDVLSVNREHKDTVFRMIYRDREELLILYNALNGTDYEDPEQLTVTNAGKCDLFWYEKRCILSAGFQDDVIRASVHMESEYPSSGTCFILPVCWKNM